MAQKGLYTISPQVGIGSSSVTLGSNGSGYVPNTAWAGSPIAPLTIQSLSSHNYNSTFSFHEDRIMAPEIKKYEIYESPEDILALSVAWRKIRKHGSSFDITSLLEQKLFERLTVEDRETANVIRDYYSKKIMMWKLKGKELTSFRKDLNTFVHNDGMKFKKEMIGLAYHLPEFYAYDSELDTVREQVKTKDLVTSDVKKLLPLVPKLSIASKKLTPLKRINRLTKRINQMQYWFKDNETDGAVLIDIDSKNPLEHIWNNIFDNSRNLIVKGKYYTKDREDFEYFNIKNWSLEKG